MRICRPAVTTEPTHLYRALIILRGKIKILLFSTEIYLVHKQIHNISVVLKFHGRGIIGWLGKIYTLKGFSGGNKEQGKGWKKNWWMWLTLGCKICTKDSCKAKKTRQSNKRQNPHSSGSNQILGESKLFSNLAWHDRRFFYVPLFSRFWVSWCLSRFSLFASLNSMSKCQSWRWVVGRDEHEAR